MIALNFDVLGGNNYSHTGTGLLRHIDRRVDGKRARPIRRDNAVKCKISVNLICWNAQRRENVTRYAAPVPSCAHCARKLGGRKSNPPTADNRVAQNCNVTWHLTDCYKFVKLILTVFADSYRNVAARRVLFKASFYICSSNRETVCNRANYDATLCVHFALSLFLLSSSSSSSTIHYHFSLCALSLFPLSFSAR